MKKKSTNIRILILLLILVLLLVYGALYMEPFFLQFLSPHQTDKVFRKLFDDDSSSSPKVYLTSPTLLLDTIIVGGGIAGVGAAQACVDHNMSCLILEKNDYIGGHARTLKMPSKIASNGVECNVDVAFLWGKNYYHLERAIKRLGLIKVDEKIEFTSGSFSNTFAANIEWNEELHRFLDQAQYVQNQQWLFQWTFSNWLKYYNFTPGFVSNVIVPALSTLLITGRGSLEKSAGMMLDMLVYDPWVNLDPEKRGIKPVFRVRNGNGQIVERLVEHYNINVRINSEVHRVTVHDDHVTFLYGNNLTLRAKNVVFATDPVTVSRIYANPSTLERAMLGYYASKTEITYGVLHSDLAVLGGATTHCVYNTSTQLMSFALGYENGSMCPYVLSIHKNKMALPSGCAGQCRWQEYEWIHPVQGLFTLMSTRMLGLPQRIHHPRVHYVGEWTLLIGHEPAYVSGLFVKYAPVTYEEKGMILRIRKLIGKGKNKIALKDNRFTEEDFEDMINFVATKRLRDYPYSALHRTSLDNEFTRRIVRAQGYT